MIIAGNEEKEHTMSNQHQLKKSASRINVMDALLYTLAGSAMLIISISFLLWLQF